MRLRESLSLFSRGFALFGRAFWEIVAALVALNMIVAGVTALAVAAVSELAWAQHALVFAEGEITVAGIARLALQAGVPAALAIGLLSAAVFLAVAALFGARARGGAGLGLGGALLRGIRRALPFAGAWVTAAAEAVLAFLLAPLLSAAGIVLLIVRGAAMLLRRFRLRGATAVEPPATGYWLSWPMLVAFAIPFGAAAVIVTHSLLLLPVAAHERHGVLGLLRRSSELTRGRAGGVALVGLGGFLLYGLLAAGVTVLGQLGLSPAVLVVVSIVLQCTLAAAPIALLVAIYLSAIGGRVPAALALSEESAERRIRVAAVATGAATALVLGLLVPIATTPSAWAAEERPLELASPEEGSAPADDVGDEESAYEVSSTDEEEDVSTEEAGEDSSAPEWWSLGRPHADGRIYGSAACSILQSDYETEWGAPLPKPTLGMCIDSLADTSDALPGDGWCETVDGSCTLRAAIEELNVWRAGVAGIYPATEAVANGTIVLEAPLVVQRSVEISGKGFSYVAFHFPDAAGLTIDGGDRVQLLRFGGGASNLVDVTLRGGFAPTGSQGGAVRVMQGSVQLRNVLVDGNYAADAGAAGAVAGSVQAEASAFTNNGIPACGAGFSTADAWGTTTLDVDDPSCPGTVSAATSLSTSVSVHSNPLNPKKGGAVTYHATVTKTQIGAEELAGTVTFHVAGREPLTAVVPADGQVSVTTTAAGTETYTVRTVYSGSEGYRGSQGETTVTTDGTASMLGLALQSDRPGGQWHRGRPLTLTATVTSGADGGVPTGQVEFFGGGDPLGTATIGAEGRAVLETTITSYDGEPFSGTQFRWWVEARYAGDATHDASNAGEHLYLATDATTTTLTASPSSASPGEPVTVTATVMTEAPVPLPAQGTVIFRGPEGFQEEVMLGAGGAASVTLPGLPYGPQGISASFSGNRWRYVDSGDSISFPVTGKSPVAFDTSPPSTPSLVGGSPTWWVGVHAGAGVPSPIPTPTGTLRMMLGDEVVGEGELASTGAMNLVVRGLPAGSHALRIEYSGDSVYLPHSQTVAHTVQKVATSTLLTRSTQTSVHGQGVEFTASVSTSVVGQLSRPVAEGLVYLTFQGRQFATIDLAEGSSVWATLPDVFDTAEIRAHYQGTEAYGSSQSFAATHTHGRAIAEVSLELGDDVFPLYGSRIDVLVTVTGTAPTAAVPGFGQVQLYADGNPVPGSSASIGSSGTATLSVEAATLGAGIRNLEARFSGNPWFHDRSSDSVRITIEKHRPAVTLTAGAQSVWGQEVRLHADVELPWTPNPGGSDALGSVRFVLVSGVHETTLGTVAVTEQQRRATLVPTAGELRPGSYEIEARFTPSTRTSDRLSIASSERVPHEVGAVPVLIEIGGLGSVMPGAALLRSVLVREHPDFSLGERPQGSITVSVDGAALGTFALTAVDSMGPGSILSHANVTIPALAAGDHEISVEYAPAVGSPHAAQSIDIPFSAGRITPHISIDTATPIIAWGQVLFVQASATKPSADMPEPRGKIVIGDGVDLSCEFLVIPGHISPAVECGLIFPEAGNHMVHARFIPDDEEATYEEAISAPLLIVVPHSRPSLTLAAGVSDQRPTAGEDITLRWSLTGAGTGPEGGIELSVEPADAVPVGALDACDTVQRQGTCVVPLTVAGAAGVATFTADYAGDARFEAATRTAALTPRACVALDLQVEPAVSGIITPRQAPNCGEPGAAKSGYAEFTVVHFDLSPLPSNEAGFDWVLEDAVGGVDTARGRGIGMVVAPDNDWARVSFVKSFRCVEVLIDHTNVRGTTSDIRLPGRGGAPGTAPNCVYVHDARHDLRYQEGKGEWSGGDNSFSNTQSYRAQYLVGTELSGIELRPGEVDTKLYAFEGEGFERQGERGVAPRTVTGYTQLHVTFGPSCYAATTESSGPGAVSVQNPVNCEEPLSAVPFATTTPRDTPPVISEPGTVGWYAGTELRIQAKPERFRGDSIDYVRTWAGTDEHPERASAEYEVISFWDENAGALVETATVQAHERAPRVEVTFDSCHRVVLERGILSNNVSAATLPAFGTPGDCPHPLAGELLARNQPSQMRLADGGSGVWGLHDYFAEGTEVTFESEPNQSTQMVIGGVVYESQARFRIWERSRGDLPWPAQMPRASERTQKYTVTAPATFTPRYVRPDACNATTRIHSGDSSRVRVSATLDGIIEEKCETIDFDGTVRDTLFGYLPGKGSQYATLQDIERTKRGSITFTAHVDEALNPIVGWEMRAGTADPRVPERLTPEGLPLPIYGSVSVNQAAIGREITMPLGYHSLDAKAVLCQVLDYSVNVTREDEVVISDFDNGDDLLMAYPAPNCPYLPGAWTVGTRVELWAFGDPMGYRFTGWEGEVEVSGSTDPGSTSLATALGDQLVDFLGTGFPANGVTVVTIDGAAPTKRVEANYRVQCYEVSFTSKKIESSTDVTASNCPGFEGDLTLISNVTGKPYKVADVKNAAWMSEGYHIYRAGAKEMIGRYIGGTEVIGIADTSWSDQVWLGWRGDVDDYRDGGKFNPATIFVDGDKDVINRYRDRSTGEELEKIGDDIAIGMKKAVGFASIVVTDYMVNYPPIGTVFMVTEGLAMVGSLLEMAGVDSDAIAWMSYPKQITDMIKAPLACVGSWALGDSGVDKARDVMGSVSDAATKGADNAKKVAEAAAKAAAQKTALDVGNTGGRMATAKLKFYQAKLGLAKVKQVTGPLTSAVSVGTSIYGAIDDGLAWDKSAADAWTNFDAYTACVKSAVPSFLKNAMSPEQEKAIEDYAASMKEELLLQGKLSFESLTGFSVTSVPTSDESWTSRDTSATIPEIPSGVCSENGIPEAMCKKWGG